MKVNDIGILTSSLFRKQALGNTILKCSRLHPAPLRRAIQFGQYLRLRRICSVEEDFIKEAGALQTRLIARGYSRSLLKIAFKKACELTRD